MPSRPSLSSCRPPGGVEPRTSSILDQHATTPPQRHIVIRGSQVLIIIDSRGRDKLAGRRLPEMPDILFGRLRLIGVKPIFVPKSVGGIDGAVKMLFFWAMGSMIFKGQGSQIATFLRLSTKLCEREMYNLSKKVWKSSKYKCRTNLINGKQQLYYSFWKFWYPHQGQTILGYSGLFSWLRYNL